jgi:hypothetical protein
LDGRVSVAKRLTTMPFKFVLLITLTVFLSFANAQEEMLDIALIELLGELGENETLYLEEAMSAIETSPLEDNKHIKDSGVAHEDPSQ